MMMPFYRYGSDDEAEEHEDTDEGDPTSLERHERLPVAGVRVTASDLAIQTRRFNGRLRLRRALVRGAAALVVCLVGVGFFANDYPAIQLLAFIAVIALPAIAAGIAFTRYLDGTPLPLIGRTEYEPLYPPNALADNLREAMQTVLNTLAQSQSRSKKTEDLQKQVPACALAFTAFFGRSVNRLNMPYVVDYYADSDPAKNFQSDCMTFAEAISGSDTCTHEQVYAAAGRVLGSYRRLLKGRNIDDEQIAFDRDTIDPTMLPRGPEGDEAPATHLLSQSVTLLEREPDEVAQIRATDAELARVRASLSAEDVAEWSRIVTRHIPGLEVTFVNAATALGTRDETVIPYLRALGIIGESLTLILSRAKRTIAGDLETQVRFIESRHGAGPLESV